MNLSHPNHPLWSLLRLAIVNGSILAALSMITKSWDGEIGVVLAALGASSAVEVWQRQHAKKYEQNVRHEAYGRGIWDSHKPINS